MAQGTLWLQPIQRVLSSSAAPVAVPGAKAFFYLAGTTTPVAVYADVALTTPLTQPVTADGNGIFVEIFLTPGVAYKVDIQTSAGVSLTGYPADNQLSIPLSGTQTSFAGTFGETVSAGTGVYLSDGSGGKNAGQWYKWDSANPYSSTTAEIGIAPSAVTVGTSGTIQQSGQVTGLSALTIGAAYYVGTAGALTTTPPTNARLVGHADTTTSLIIPSTPPKLPPQSAIIAARSVAGIPLATTTFYGTAYDSTVETDVRWPVPIAGTVRNLFIQLDGPPGGADTFTFTIRKNAVDQTVVATVPGAALTANDITHSFTVVAGDLLSVKLVTSATAATRKALLSYLVQPSQ